MTNSAASNSSARDRRPRWSLGGVFEFPAFVAPHRLVLLFVAANFAFLAWDVYLAHAHTRLYFRIAYEWIPVFLSPLATVATLLLATSRNPGRGRNLFHLVMMLVMVAVGVVGFAMHLFSAQGLSGSLTWQGIVHAAPLLAPLSFAGVALVGIVAAAEEDPDRPGRLRLLGAAVVAPFARQQHLHLLNGMGLLAATLLAGIDHSLVIGRASGIIWTPVVGGFFLTGLVLHHAALRQPRRSAKLVYFWAMLGAVIVGLVGFAMHLEADLAGTGQFSLPRLMKGAPPFAPLLFANMGMLGLLALIEPARDEGEGNQGTDRTAA